MMKLRSLKIWTGSVMVFTLIVLLAASYYYRDDLFQTIYDPGKPFQTYIPPPAPDYGQDEAWLWPASGPGINPATQNAAKIFAITPTLYLGGEHWNAPIDDSRLLARTRRHILPNYVLGLTTAGEVFAPHYRHAALYSFMTSRDDARAAQKFAYQDVRRAFIVFLERHIDTASPVVIVGYGQGALHAARLLSDFRTEIDGQLAAAYLIDHPIPLDAFQSGGLLSGFRPCEGETDAGCIIGFGGFEPGETARANYFVSRALFWEPDEDMRSVEGRPVLCLNPLLWAASGDYAPARLHKGGAAASGMSGDAAPAPSPQQTGAQCQDGILVLDRPRQTALRRKRSFGSTYKTLPFNLFYEDIRTNAKVRIASWTKQQSGMTAAPLPDAKADTESSDAPLLITPPKQ